jgi:hypothetical protein
MTDESGCSKTCSETLHASYHDSLRPPSFQALYVYHNSIPRTAGARQYHSVLFIALYRTTPQYLIRFKIIEPWFSPIIWQKVFKCFKAVNHNESIAQV